MKDSYLAYPEAIAVFDKAIQNVGIREMHCIDIQPINDYTNQSVIEFNIPSNSVCYINLKKTTLSIRCKVVKADGSKTDATANAVVVTVVNNFLNSIMSRCDLALQDRVMTSSDQMYPYRAYFNNLLYIYI